MRLNKIFNAVNNKERGHGQPFGSSVVSLACITSMCSVQCFPGGHSLCSALGSFFYPHPSPPFILPLLNQCDGCLVPLAWGLMAGGRGFASHGGATLSRGWLCQGGSPWTSPAPTSTSDAVVNFFYLLQFMTKFTFEQCLLFWLLFELARNRVESFPVCLTKLSSSFRSLK